MNEILESQLQQHIHSTCAHGTTLGEVNKRSTQGFGHPGRFHGCWRREEKP